MQHLPGMTRVKDGPADHVVPFKHNPAKKVIVLATATISDGSIFSNGLYQNILIIYRLLEAMDYIPIMLVNEKPTKIEDVPPVLRKCRVTIVEELVRTPTPLLAYIEIGMSIHPSMRQFMKMMGAKNCKLYLGNILNIDIETPTYYPQMNFSHHIVGEMDEIWVSPHYAQHDQYAAALNHVIPGSPQQKIAPYVWDPCFLTLDGERKLNWRPKRQGEEDVFVIMEPNISFQKCSFVALWIAEMFYRSHPAWKGQVLCINGERMLSNPFFKENIWPQITLARDNKIQMIPRKDMVSVMTDYPWAVPICHQLNNEFNYMTFEYFHAGFPVLHNAGHWEQFGYSYKGSDIRGGVQTLERILAEHADKQERYKSDARALLWRHCIYNPDVQRGWKELIES